MLLHLKDTMDLLTENKHEDLAKALLKSTEDFTNIDTKASAPAFEGRTPRKEQLKREMRERDRKRKKVREKDTA